MVTAVTWSIVTDYLCHNLPRICSICRSHNDFLSSIMAYHMRNNKSNTMSTSDRATTTLQKQMISQPILMGFLLFILSNSVSSCFWSRVVMSVLISRKRGSVRPYNRLFCSSVFMLFVLISAYKYPTRFPYHMIFV